MRYLYEEDYIKRYAFGYGNRRMRGTRGVQCKMHLH